MSYNHSAIVVRIKASLQLKPTMTIRDLAATLGIHRQTVLRTLKSEVGVSFEEFKAASVDRLLAEITTSDAIVSRKQLAARLGCSRATLNRWLKRSRPSDRRGSLRHRDA